jgi:hypothetical protein
LALKNLGTTQKADMLSFMAESLREKMTNRWGTWAKSLAERHGRIPLRHGALAMTLVERLWNMSSHLHFAMAPILRQTLEKEGHRQTLLVENCRQILQRVVDQRQRVEERIQRPAIVRQQPPPARTFARDEHELRPEQSRTRPPAQTWPPATSPPAINLEQLTDQVVRQIDRRFVAYRERMGKPF